MRKPLPFAIVVLLGIGFDLLTKWIAFQQLTDRQVYVLIPNVLILEHAENHGVAFSLFSGHPWFILTVTSVAIAFIVWLYASTRRTTHGLAIVAMAMILIGAAGNLIDRLYFGFVRDFIDFVPRIPLVGNWAVFNVADIAITVGVLFYAIVELFLLPHDKPKTPVQPPSVAPDQSVEHHSGA